MTAAQRRLVFEDFFVFQTGLALRRKENAQVRKLLVSKVDDRIRQRAREVLPFKLTAGQRDALAGDRRRHAEGVADAAAAAGRCRRRQDHRRDPGRGGRDGERLSGGGDGADRDPRRAALPHDRESARREAVSGRAAERPRDGSDAARSAAGHRARRDQPRGRHSGAGPGARQVQGARAGGDRRAASLRRGAARHAGRQGREPGRAGDDRHADSAHAGADRVRRHGGVGDPRVAAGPPADQDHRQGRLASRRGLRDDARRDPPRPAGLRDLPAGRGVREDRSQGRHRDVPTRSRASFRSSASRCCTAA